MPYIILDPADAPKAIEHLAAFGCRAYPIGEIGEGTREVHNQVRGDQVEIDGYLQNNLHVLRATRKWSQQEVADRLGVSRQTIASIEANRYNPSLILAFMIADLFEVDINQVFQYAKYPEEDE